MMIMIKPIIIENPINNMAKTSSKMAIALKIFCILSPFFSKIVIVLLPKI